MEFLYPKSCLRSSCSKAVVLPRPRAHARGEEDKPARPAGTIFPRYHQSRMVRKVADDTLKHFAATGEIGRK